MTASDGAAAAIVTAVDAVTASGTVAADNAAVAADIAATVDVVTAVDAATLLFVTAAVTAVVGGLVASLAHRGYRRNGSEAMRFLAVGIVCFTVVPFLVTYGVGPAFGASDAGTLLGVLLANVAGLLAVLYSLEGT